MKNILTLMRPHQYVKNIFIFLPLFFSGNFQNITMLFNAFVVFIGFSFVASAIYILNDYLDIEEDKQHPVKKNRPLASGSIKKLQAIYLMLFLSGIGFIIMSMVSWKAVTIQIVYIVLNIAYSLYLKHIAIIDVVIIAIGFVVGGYFGSKIALKMSPARVKLIFGVLMLYISFKMIYSGIKDAKNEKNSDTEQIK